MDPDTIHREWHDRSGEFSPGYYAYYGPNEASEAIRDRLDSTVEPDAAVLELGCSSGRHLAHLHGHGYRDLAGVEINGDAADVMRDAYPDLADAGTFHYEAIEAAVPGFEDGAFDAVYSVETLQHIHPDNDWVFADVARVAADVLVTVEIEADAGEDMTYVNDEFPLYYRDWGDVFGALGFEQVAVEELDRDTLRVFRPD